MDRSTVAPSQIPIGAFDFLVIDVHNNSIPSIIDRNNAKQCDSGESKLIAEFVDSRHFKSAQQISIKVVSLIPFSLSPNNLVHAVVTLADRKMEWFE